ncbi:ylmG homolog protein 2, chloroplastic [Silene latifolia]|uniref:ylmG homolog protein 2, chloroplastic n=1 Tax=Silene latifolia TaxID=37657 RepID=UPI003D76E5BB
MRGLSEMCYLEGEGERQKGSIESETQRMEYPRNVQTTFVQTHSFFFSKPNNNNNNNNSSSSNSPIIPVSPVVALHNLQKSITSAAHNFLHFILQNPLFSNLLSLSSHFHHFSQVQLRSYRSLNSLSTHNFAAVLPGDSVAGVVVSNGILNFLNLYNTILVVRLVLTWFPNTPPQIVSPLSTLCDPYLNIFRGIIPPLGGTLDLSPILAFLVLNAFTSAATALPAELPPPVSSQPGLSDLTLAQNKWQRRLQGNKSSNKDTPK